MTFLLWPRLPFSRPSRAPVSAWWRGASGSVSLPPWRVCSLRRQIGVCVCVCVCVHIRLRVPGWVGFSLACPAGLLPSRSAPASRCRGSAGGHRPWGCRLQRLRLNSCAWAWLPPGMWDLPRPGITPTCPALAGRWHHWAAREAAGGADSRPCRYRPGLSAVSAGICSALWVSVTGWLLQGYLSRQDALCILDAEWGFFASSFPSSLRRVVSDVFCDGFKFSACSQIWKLASSDRQFLLKLTGENHSFQDDEGLFKMQVLLELAKKFIQVFHRILQKNPKRTFWPTQYWQWPSWASICKIQNQSIIRQTFTYA